MDNRLYDTPGLRRHGLRVDLVNKKQILFFPVLWCKNISEAAAIFDYPMDAEEIGGLVFQFFEQMKLRCLTLQDPYKDYWLRPKGIRSFKKYVEATFPVSLRLNRNVFEVFRWFPEPNCRYFTVEGHSGGCDATIKSTVSANELGGFILQQFDYIEKKRRNL